MSRHVTDGAAFRWRHVLAGLVATGACGSLLTASAIAQSPPDGRAYEMVSPVQKYQGGAVLGQRVSADGNAVGFITTSAIDDSSNAYALAPYVAHRTSQGWVTRGGAPMVSAEWRGPSVVKATMVDFSDDLSSVLLRTNDRIDPEDREIAASGVDDGGYDFYQYDVATGAASWLTRPPAALAEEYAAGAFSGDVGYLGASRDGSRTFFVTSRRLTLDAPLTGVKLYERAGGVVRLASVLPDGTPTVTLSDVISMPPVQGAHGTSAVSDDGSRLFFNGGPGANPPLYVRENGTTTLPISASRRASNPGATTRGTFLAASRDGSVAYFHTPLTRLTDDASGGGFYRWERGDDSLRFLGRASSFQAPAMASDDGSRFYFATTATTVTPDAVSGDRNLYLYEEGEPVRLVASLSANHNSIGVDQRLVITPDGRYAYFTSLRSLDPRVAEGVLAIYRYDAETDEIICVSCRADGVVATRHSRFRPARTRYAETLPPTSQVPLSLTEDGRFYFESDEPLVAHDVNGAVDVYEFDGTGVKLISSGRGEGSEYVDNSADGRSVFFITAEKLLPQDIDGGYPDVYVARVGGGFPVPPEAPQPCEGDNCQGPLTSPPAFGAPGSGQVTPSDDADDAPPVTASFKLLRPGRTSLRRFATRGRISLSVRVDDPGSVLVSARGRIGRRQRSLGQGWKNATRRGTVRVVVPLNRVAIRQLAARRALRVTLTVRHSGADDPRQMTLRLRRPARAVRAKAVRR